MNHIVIVVDISIVSFGRVCEILFEIVEDKATDTDRGSTLADISSAVSE